MRLRSMLISMVCCMFRHYDSVLVMRDAERRTKRRALTRIIHSVLRKDDGLHYFQVRLYRALSSLSWQRANSAWIFDRDTMTFAPCFCLCWARSGPTRRCIMSVPRIIESRCSPTLTLCYKLRGCCSHCWNCKMKSSMGNCRTLGYVLTKRSY